MSSRIVAETIRAGETVRIASPGVGVVADLPHDGDWLASGARIGTYRRLNRTVELRLASDVSGRVRNRCSRDREVPTEYRQPLFELEALDTSAAAGESSAARGKEDAESAAGGRTIAAPTDGVFYRRATPDAAPFVDAGQKIQRGQTIGLIEVMKTFNQIAFDGHGVPDAAEILEILVEDSQEVAAGQPLLRYRG